MREAQIEGDGLLDAADVLPPQMQAQRLDVAPQMVDAPPADDGEDVGALVQDVRERHARERRALLACDLFEHLADLDGRVRGGDLAALLGLRGALLLRLEGAAAESAPRREAHVLLAGHVDDVALEVAAGSGPAALVDGELAQSMVAGVLICFAGLGSVLCSRKGKGAKRGGSPTLRPTPACR